MVIGPNSRHTMVSRRQFFALNNSTNSLKDPTEINLVMLGALEVGKSALTVRFITRRFIMEYDPTLEDTFSKNTQVDGHDVIIRLMDTYDQESRSPERYLKWAHGYLVVYSITDLASFEAAKTHLSTVAQQQRDDSATYKPIALIGNKMDLERYRTISKASGQELASQYDCFFHETSAAEDCDSVEEAFMEVVREVFRQRERQAPLQPLFISEDKAGLVNGAGRGTSHFRRTKSPKSQDNKEIKEKDKESKTLPRRTGSTFKILKGFKLFN